MGLNFGLGYVALFVSSFLAATVIPFSSEAILSTMLLMGYDPALSLLLATAGNWLGGLTSYALGYWARYDWIERYLRISKEKTDKYIAITQKRGVWIALFTWLPLVGDIIAVALGMIKAPFWRTSAGMLIGKAARYAVWGWITLKGIELLG